MERTGYRSYRAGGIAARTTSDPTGHTPGGELMPRWVAEIGDAGWSIERIVAAVDTRPPNTAGSSVSSPTSRLRADAAASLLEGLKEMFTVRRLGVGDRLARFCASVVAF